MSAVKELIRKEADGSISFGDYELAAKTKKSDFEVNGDRYKVKTFKEITRLEKNEMMIYESEPGTAVIGLKCTENEISFSVEGPEDAMITVTGEPDTEYDVYLNDALRETQKSNLGGKISFSVELGSAAAAVKLCRK